MNQNKTTTTVTATDTICDRCDCDLSEAVERALVEGGPEQCPLCGLAFQVGDDYLEAGGYAATVTDGQIERLRVEADNAGDLEQVALCLRALGEDPADAEPGTALALLSSATQEEARAECARVIAEAEALKHDIDVDPYGTAYCDWCGATEDEPGDCPELAAQASIDSLDALLAALRAGRVQLDDNLPTFGGDWDNPEGVWSWDERRALVGTCADDLEIVPRGAVEA